MARTRQTGSLFKHPGGRVGTAWSVLGPHHTGIPRHAAGTSGQRRRISIAGHKRATAMTSAGRAALDRVRAPPPTATRPTGRLPARPVVTGDGPHPPAELVAVPAT